MDHTNGDAPDVAAAPNPSAEALEFVRFCHRRRRVGWPELYDEMCAVAGRGLYLGYGPEELASFGIGFGLFQMPALATLVGKVVAEDQERRRQDAEAVRTTVVLTGRTRRREPAEPSSPVDGATEAVAEPEPSVVASEPPAVAYEPTADRRPRPEPTERAPEHGTIRIALAAGA
jgi:hypothetical protein